MSGTSETGSTATEHHEIPDNGLCMQHCQGGAGNRAATGEKCLLQRSNHLSWLFSPAAGGRRTVQTYRAGPTHLAPTNIATSGTHAHNKSDCANTRCDDKERTLRRQGTNAEQTNQEATNTTTHRQNHYSGRNVTVNRPRAHGPVPSWPGMHGPVRERRPTS